MPQKKASENSEAQAGSRGKHGWWDRTKSRVLLIDREVSFVKGLSLVTVVSGLAGGYFQYTTAYQDRVKTVATQQINAAEQTYADISMAFSKAITLQQYLFFDYRDSIKFNTDGDERALNTKNARAIFQQYDDLRIALRENIDLFARKVEVDLDWSSDIGRDAAKVKTIGRDKMTRLALGHYDFACDSDKYMPSFKTPLVSVPPSADVLKDDAKADPLYLDWNSTKHQLLVLYFCFEGLHHGIAAALSWASGSTVAPGAKDDFKGNLKATQDKFDREAVRLNAFTTLAARRIEDIHVKFRPRSWYCHVPVLSEILTGFANLVVFAGFPGGNGFCSPIRTADIGSVS